jgi:hypothetical protein
MGGWPLSLGGETAVLMRVLAGRAAKVLKDALCFAKDANV